MHIHNPYLSHENECILILINTLQGLQQPLSIVHLIVLQIGHRADDFKPLDGI